MTTRSPLKKDLPSIAVGAVLLGVMVLGVTQAIALPGTRGPSGNARNGGHCEAVRVPVALAPAEPATDTIAGTLCNPRSGPSKTIELLVHGSTYASYVWAFPYHPETYSYVDYMLKAGYSTLNIDRIGDGASSHPPSRFLDVYHDAFELHELVLALREGRVGGAAFSRVVTVGHSLGALITDYEAATYQDVDGMVATGILFTSSASGIAQSIGTAYPANQDPKFAKRGFDNGYITTRPGVRGKVYYYLPNADPKVIALDEQLKQTRGINELPTGYNELANGDTRKVGVPTLVAVGRYDLFGCSSFLNKMDATDCTSAKTILKEEAPHWSPVACLHVADILHSGHDINLQRNAQVWFKIARQWSDEFIGPNGLAHPTPNDCTEGTAITAG